MRTDIAYMGYTVVPVNVVPNTKKSQCELRFL